MILGLCANIGCEDYVKRATTVNFSTSTICERCPSVIFSQNSVDVKIEIVCTFTLTQILR